MSFDIQRMFKREFNIGERDQQIRLAVGVGLMVVASIMESGLLMLLGLVVATLALLKWCPAYSAIGKSTVGPEDKPPII
ncbi:MAG: DUF2892 domain-containing protein [Methylococcus sp.]